MYAKTYGATTMGVDGLLITVEVDCANGLPAFDIVGLPDTAVRESKERVRTAIKNAGIALKQEKVTINLAPADVRKDSSGLDLPIAMGLLAAYGIVAEERMEHALFAAELSLEGKLRSIRGILPMTVNARQMGFRKIFVASGNANEALLVDGIEVYAVDTLSELVDGLLGKQLLRPAEPAMAAEDEKPEFTDDFADVQGQFLAKRALEIAAAGGHNVLMAGVPGSGKTMLARRMSSILPELTREEALEVTKIYSIAGMLPQHGGLMKQRPFRSPHHNDIDHCHDRRRQHPATGRGDLEPSRDPVSGRAAGVWENHAGSASRTFGRQENHGFPRQCHLDVPFQHHPDLQHESMPMRVARRSGSHL